ncbi:MAG: GNAT family acetyltransferase [Campylobacteraceae bacterium]|nr:GNAT family acetyltransferase [Campylobacteraceae bacterium]
MLIKKYNNTHRAGLISLWENAFPNNPEHDEPNLMLDLKLKIDDLIFVALEDEKIIGSCMAGYDGHRGYLYSVAVSSEIRKGGVGRKLVSYTIDELKKLGCTKVNLHIRPTNTEVAQFYRSLGFEVEERICMSKLI